MASVHNVGLHKLALIGVRFAPCWTLLCLQTVSAFADATAALRSVTGRLGLTPEAVAAAMEDTEEALADAAEVDRIMTDGMRAATAAAAVGGDEVLDDDSMLRELDAALAADVPVRSGAAGAATVATASAPAVSAAGVATAGATAVPVADAVAADSRTTARVAVASA